MSETRVMSGRTVNETHFQYLGDHEGQTAADSSPTINVLGGFTGGGNNLGNSSNNSDHYELQNETSMALGKQMLRFGGRLRDLNEADATTAGFNGAFTFSSLSAYQITEQGLAAGWTPAAIRAAGGGASQFTLVSGKPLASVNLFDAGLFFEDSWRIRQNLSLNLGLRYEGQGHISDHADFAPRLGLAWGLGHGASVKTVLRAGFGMFYDRFQEAQLLEAERLNGTNQQSTS